MATWCIPCRDEMPELQELHNRYSHAAFSVVGLSIDQGHSSIVERFLDELNVTPDPAIVGAGLARGGWPRPGAGYWKHSAGLWKSTARGPTFKGT
ncbi:TlpA disulfide reductase family protein [Candidatus Palauibacter sp.]|uniref:TlpA disulfide reductase family protein n=1 Tax=Candidatus Palauibacter sp. TaxID=3101350 RepID=UPI003AF28685